MHTGLVTAKGKEKPKKNPKQTLPIHDVPLHCTSQGGPGSHRAPSVNQGQDPTGNFVTRASGLSSLWSLLVAAGGVGRFQGPRPCTRGPCLPRVQGLGARTRADSCAIAHVTKTTTSEGGRLCLPGNHPSSLGIETLYNCITVEGKRDYLE